MVSFMVISNVSPMFHCHGHLVSLWRVFHIRWIFLNHHWVFYFVCLLFSLTLFKWSNSLHPESYKRPICFSKYFKTTEYLHYRPIIFGYSTDILIDHLNKSLYLQQEDQIQQQIKAKDDYCFDYSKTIYALWDRLNLEFFLPTNIFYS